MNQKAELLRNFIDADFGISGNGRWLRGKQHNSLILDAENGVFFFNSRGIYGGPLEYLRFVRGLSLQASEDLLSKSSEKFWVSKNPIYSLETSVPYDKLIGALYTSGLDKRDYWYNRLLLDDTINRFQLGYFDGWSTIPIFQNGNLVQIQKRKENPKSIFPWYKGVTPKIFNSDILKFTDTIVFTEGIVDAILMNQFGVPSVSKSIGAVGWHEEWFPLFMSQKLIYIVYDNDKAGMDGAIKMSKHLGVNRCKIYTFPDKRESYDIIDWFRDFNTLEELMYLIRKESKYGFEIRSK